MENLKYTFDQVNEWIKTADQKALILGSVNVAGVAYQTANLNRAACEDVFTIAMFSFSIIAALAAMYFWVSIIYPRLGNKLRKSKIYFLHIANAYEDDLERGIEDLQSIQEEDFQKDLASQVVINSIIAKKKYINIQRFIWAFAVQVFFTLVFLIALF